MNIVFNLILFSFIFQNNDCYVMMSENKEYFEDICMKIDLESECINSGIGCKTNMNGDGDTFINCKSIFEKVYIMSESGIDSVDCGNFSNPCQSISFVLNLGDSFYLKKLYFPMETFNVPIQLFNLCLIIFLFYFILFYFILISLFHYFIFFFKLATDFSFFPLTDAIISFQGSFSPSSFSTLLFTCAKNSQDNSKIK
jgi:hypothetical protein